MRPPDPSNAGMKQGSLKADKQGHILINNQFHAFSDKPRQTDELASFRTFRMPVETFVVDGKQIQRAKYQPILTMAEEIGTKHYKNELIGPDHVRRKINQEKLTVAAAIMEYPDKCTPILLVDITLKEPSDEVVKQLLHFDDVEEVGTPKGFRYELGAPGVNGPPPGEPPADEVPEPPLQRPPPQRKQKRKKKRRGFKSKKSKKDRRKR